MTNKKKGELEKMGEFVGGGVKQGGGVINGFGKGIKKSFSEKKK